MKLREIFESSSSLSVIYKPKKFTHGKLGVPVTDDPHDTHSLSQSQHEYGSERDQLHPEQVAVMKGAIGVPNENPYDLYRLGMAIAGGDRNTPGTGHIGQTAVILPFSEIEHNNIKSRIRQQGLKPKDLSTGISEEPGQNNTTSPIAKRKPNRYGV
jgi:hypothetical protein